MKAAIAQANGRSRVLYPYQQRAVSYAVGVRHPAFFMEMRLGKTLTTLRWLESVGADSVLVVAPLTVLIAWEKECKAEGRRYRWLRDTGAAARYAVVTGTAGPCVFLISYEALRETPALAGVDRVPHGGRWRFVAQKDPYVFDAVVLDESTKIKNPKATITKVCVAGFRGTPHRAILCGMPAPETPMEYFTQFAFLRGGMMGERSYYRWVHRWFDGDDKGWNRWPKPGFRDALKSWLGERAFVLRRRDAGVGSKTVFERRTITPPEKQRKAYAHARDAFAYRYLDGRVRETKTAVEAFTWLQRIAGGCDPDGNLVWDGKLRELIGLLKSELAREAVVVWCRFNAEIAHIKSALLHEGIDARSMVGDDDATTRSVLIDGFNRGHFQVFVVQQALGQFGLDLSRADTAIYYSNNPSYEQRAQSADRIVHPSKSHPLLVIDLTTLGLVDDDLVTLLEAKKGDTKWLMAELARMTAARTLPGGNG